MFGLINAQENSQISNGLKITDLPSWVVLEDTPNHLPLGDLKVVNWLLSDIQIHVEEETRFYHYVEHIIDSVGVQNYSKISLSYDPKYETAELHSLKIIRDGCVINKLHDVEVRLVQDESESHRHIYNGSLSAHIFLNDTREGDIVEYSYSIKGFPPVYKPHFALEYFWHVVLPVRKQSLRVIAKQTRALNIKNHGLSFQPKKTFFADMQEIVWSQNDNSVYNPEKDSPSWAQGKSKIEITDYPNWQTLVENEIVLFPMTNRETLPQEMVDLAKKWMESSPSKDEQALYALRFVQDQIRYLAFEDGLHAYKPHDPAWVFKNRFGDCKDKAQLLRAFLDLMQIESSPVFVNGYKTRSLSDNLPSPYVFNHVIVQIIIDDKIFWVDPTRSHQGGTLANAIHSHYEYGLIIKKGENALSKIPKSEHAKIEFTADVLLGQADNALLNICIVNHGWEAEYWRRKYSSLSSQKISENWEKWLTSAFGPGKIKGSCEILDERALNQLTTKISYNVDNYFEYKNNEKFKRIEITAACLRNKLPSSCYDKREYPLTHEYPLEIEENYRVIHNLGIILVKEYHKEISNEIFNYNLDSKCENNQINISYRYKSLRDYVFPSEISKYNEDLEVANDTSRFVLLLPDNTYSDWIDRFLYPFLAIFGLFVVGFYDIYQNKNKKRKLDLDFEIKKAWMWSSTILYVFIPMIYLVISNFDQIINASLIIIWIPTIYYSYKKPVLKLLYFPIFYTVGCNIGIYLDRWRDQEFNFLNICLIIVHVVIFLFWFLLSLNVLQILRINKKDNSNNNAS